ncbi:hypothetical protein T11_16954 [Trichinella zimbabwensis]|uniref:Uncharacterized protein n=1 Tax=Trichinella zimbabwensis TaxID=268475 RepID=A0A0V1GCW5_9BILA|nr:hypothetical protein T11_16954 [Trichinella zimbabwensis]
MQLCTVSEHIHVASKKRINNALQFLLKIHIRYEEKSVLHVSLHKYTLSNVNRNGHKMKTKTKKYCARLQDFNEYFTKMSKMFPLLKCKHPASVSALLLSCVLR